MEYICACWNGVMRSAGESITTRIPGRPSSAYSAAEPVSPEVAPRMVKRSPRRASSWANSSPSSCMAMSLKAADGPLLRCANRTPSESSETGTICGSENFSGA